MINNNNQLVPIGKLAESANVTLRTIRHYGELGLLPPAGKSKGGQALYASGDLIILQRIQALKEAGLSLAEIKDIFNAVHGEKTKNKELTILLRKTIERQYDAIYKREKHLEQIRSALDVVLNKTSGCQNCPAKGPEKDCKGCGNLELLKTVGVKIS